MTRRAASVTQADAARFMRAAKQVGGYVIELRDGALRAVILNVAEEPVEVAPAAPTPKKEFDPI